MTGQQGTGGWGCLARLGACLLAGLILPGAAGAARPPAPNCPVPTYRPVVPSADEALRPVPAAPGLPGVPSASFPLATTVRPGALVDPPVPSVAIRVRVPVETAVGRELIYRIVAENVSRAVAHHVTISVPINDPKLPMNARYARATPVPDEEGPVLVWKLGTLKGLEKREIRLVVRPTGDGDVSCCARVRFEHGQCVRTRLARAGLQVRKTGPKEAPLYDSLTFRIEVRNTGRTTARNVVVEETLPDWLETIGNPRPSTPDVNPMVWKLGNLAPGVARVMEYQAIPKEAGTLTTVAVVRADGFEKKVEHRLEVLRPRLTVVKTGPKKALAGWPVTYRLTVSNTGTWAATDVALFDELPKEIAFVSATEGGKFERDTILYGDVRADAARWHLGTLKPGASKTVRLVVRGTKPEVLYKNVCIASAERCSRVQSRTETKFSAEAKGLGLLLEASDERVRPGERVSMTVRVLNAGKVNEENVAVVVTVPKGLTVLEVPGVPKALIKDGKVTLRVPGSLLPAREQTVVIRLRADSEGDYKIKGTATSDAVGPDGAARDEEGLKVTKPRPKMKEEPGPREAEPQE